MIERLPLDIFGAKSDSDDEERLDAPLTDPADGEAVDIVIEPTPANDILLASCQWCSEQFDYDISSCPHCNATHFRESGPAEEPSTTTCQWCLTTFDVGPETCPECNARVTVPGQNVPGAHEVGLDFNRLGVMSQRAHSTQLLTGMIMVDGIDSVFGGLIGIALSFLDDD